MSIPVSIPVDHHKKLDGDLTVPHAATGLVLFAHGSGSSRRSPRNKFVAHVLEQHGLATLLTDLLTRDEEMTDARTAELRFDIDLLAGRLASIIDWLGERTETASLPIGLFGASTGGGAALVAAALRPDRVAAVVSRGGRPDLAGAALPRVACPTLLILGGHDDVVIDLNKRAMTKMRAPVTLEIIPGATHLFEEPGTLEQVATLTAEFFVKRLEP